MEVVILVTAAFFTGIGLGYVNWGRGSANDYNIGYQDGTKDATDYTIGDEYSIGHRKGYEEGLADGSCKCPTKIPVVTRPLNNVSPDLEDMLREAQNKLKQGQER